VVLVREVKRRCEQLPRPIGDKANQREVREHMTISCQAS
jgi:hypothetical protein